MTLTRRAPWYVESTRFGLVGRVDSSGNHGRPFNFKLLLCMFAQKKKAARRRLSCWWMSD